MTTPFHIYVEIVTDLFIENSEQNFLDSVNKRRKQKYQSICWKHTNNTLGKMYMTYTCT